MNCSICGKNKKLKTHHLSYDEPEVTIEICGMCHSISHFVSVETLNKIIDLKNKYEHLWENGEKKYRKTEHCKNYQKEYKKTDEYKIKDIARKSTPKKMLKRIENMERQIKLIK